MTARTAKTATAIALMCAVASVLPAPAYPGPASFASVPAERPAPLVVWFPMPPFLDEFGSIEYGPHIQPPPTNTPPPILAPVGTSLLSAASVVTSSDSTPLHGGLSAVVDGVKGHQERTNAVVLHPGVQWIQIDLGHERSIYAIAIWHLQTPLVRMRGVVVQISDDPSFKEGVTTLFNNDYLNQVGLGAGDDLEYYETFRGKLVEPHGRRARYVRLYSNGTSRGAKDNPYAFVDVYGLP